MHRVLERAGKCVILLGNEAIVRGALESGIGFASTYPGTPASEVGDTFAEIAKEAGIYFEYSVNEKVATEAAAAAAWCGVRSLVAFKHFGFNVASDSIFPLAYYGLKAGMVIVMADDPGCWSSGQSEQDSRAYARIAHMPLFEPSDPAECLAFTKKAFTLSERLKIPCIIRLTTRVSHASADVRLGKIVKSEVKGTFSKGSQFRTMPPTMLAVHSELHKKLLQAAKESEKFAITKPGAGKFGIITSSVGYCYAMEALKELKIKIPLLKLGITWPLPEKSISNFIKNLNSVLIIEELEPILQHDIERIARTVNPKLKIYGKDCLPTCCELKPEYVIETLGKILKIKTFDFSSHLKKISNLAIPKRIPTLCPGCPHRATFWAAKIASPQAVYGGDIGCYILGIYPPLQTQDYIISMGAVQGLSHGISKMTKKPVIAFIGDSTFFHAGIPGLINMAYNQSDPLVIVLDNKTTAMTGHQPHPGTGITGMGESVKKISIENIAKACGIENVEKANIWNVKETIEKIRQLLAKSGPKVLIADGECRLQFMRRARRQGLKVPIFSIDPDKCKRCTICVYKFGCPAIHHNREKNLYYIDPELCWGCGVCSQICPYQAIYERI
jgi:indolepyruvate ferredoxin oxidoreductase alpha subunit